MAVWWPRRSRASTLPSMQGGGWHGKPATGDALKKALAELDQKRVEVTSALVTSDQFEIEPPPEMTKKDVEPGEMMSLTQFMKKMDMESMLQTGQMATRPGLRDALAGPEARSTTRWSYWTRMSPTRPTPTFFKKDAALAPRFLECKIAEQNMFSVGAGVSAGNKIPSPAPSPSSSRGRTTRLRWPSTAVPTSRSWARTRA